MFHSFIRHSEVDMNTYTVSQKKSKHIFYTSRLILINFVYGVLDKFATQSSVNVFHQTWNPEVSTLP